jgi:hypothetical protein
MNTAERSWRVLFFPHYVFESVPVEAVQQSLRRIFTHWGLPRFLRVDNGQPWGSRSDLPSQLTLWLLGLGVEVIHNRPYHPTENARVERCHSTMKAWVEPQRCPNLAALQHRLDEAARLQRELYPLRDGCSRSQAYPSLATNPRRYQPQQESQQWRIERVLSYLRCQRWSRKVDAGGRISLFNRNYFVTRRQAGQRVYVRVDPEQVAWVVENQQGQVLARPACPQLCARSICQLEVLYREPSRPRRGA